MDDDIRLIVEQADGSYKTVGFTGVPAARPSLIAIVSAGSAEARANVAQLATELEAALLGAIPGVVRKERTGASPADIDTAAHPDRVKLLVLVGGGDVPFTHAGWHAGWAVDDRAAAIMILLPPGDYYRNFDATIGPDHLLRAVNAMHWRSRIDESLPAILARAEVTALESRIFISYRRVETLPMALQLFDRLAEERFSVFLDRFSIPPGYDFQRRLNQELADKSMVLLLESKRLRDSEWTQHEIDFAKRNRLGLLALRLPDVTDADRLPSVAGNARMALQAADFEGPSTPTTVAGVPIDQWPRLTAAALDRVVQRAKEAHADALFRRRHRLRADLVAALSRQPNVTARYSPVGPLTVDCGSERHMLWPVTRPPASYDFRSLHGAHLAATGRSAASRAIIIGPQAALETDRHAELRWLSDVSSCLCYDEGDLAGFARRLATGSWA